MQQIEYVVVELQKGIAELLAGIKPAEKPEYVYRNRKEERKVNYVQIFRLYEEDRRRK